MSSKNAYATSPSDMHPDDIFGYKVVAVISTGGFWAAYRGLTDKSDDEIVLFGDKIRYEAAKYLFPSIDDNFIWSRRT